MNYIRQVFIKEKVKDACYRLLEIREDQFYFKGLLVLTIPLEYVL